MELRQRAVHVGIAIEILYSDEDVFDVKFSAGNGAFGGATRIWVEIGGLDTLADKISGFPKGPQDSRELVLGAFGREYAGGATHLRLFCIDLAGHSYIESKIESGEESAGVFQTAIVIMPVEASAIDRFVTGLRKIEKARNGTAVLESRG
jgi:hypothetical protein